MKTPLDQLRDELTTEVRANLEDLEELDNRLAADTSATSEDVERAEHLRGYIEGLDFARRLINQELEQ